MWFLGAVGAIELVALAALAWAAPAFPIPGILLFAGAVSAYVAGAMLVRRAPDASSALLLVVSFAVAMRLVLLPAEIRLSDDIWRYLWDGHVGAAGVNPYLYPPSHSALEGLRTAWHAWINNPTVSTIYGPTAQFAFRLFETVGGTVLSAKVGWVALDLATLALLVRHARSTSRHVALVALLYAWSPLLVVEVAWSGHLEPLGLVFVVAVIALSRSGNKTRIGATLAGAAMAGVALAGAAMTKFAPVAVAPVLFRYVGSGALKSKRGWAFVAGLAGALFVGLLPFLDAGPKLWSGLATYAEHWRFNTGAFAAVERAIADPLHARYAVGVIVVLVIGACAWKRVDAERAFLWVLGAGVVLSPTVHPWYVLWLLPVAALRGSLPWLYLSCSVFLAYWGLDAFQATGAWPEPAWVRAAIWVPFFVLLLRDGVGWIRRRADSEGGQREPDVSAGEEE